MVDYLPPKWGPSKGLNTKDFVLWMAGEKITDPLVDLIGHSLTSPNQNLTDALLYTTVVRRKGKVVPISRVNRAARETSRTYTIGLPSALWTPVKIKSLANGCDAHFFLIYECPEDAIFNYFQAMLDGSLSPVIESTDVIVNTEDDSVIEWTTELQIPELLEGFALGGSILYDATFTVSGFDFLYDDCEACGEAPAFDYVLVGIPAALAKPPYLTTDDRFASVDSATFTAATADDVTNAVRSFGSTVLAATADDVPGSATAGMIHISFDKGLTWTSISDGGVHVKDFVRIGNIYLGIGSDGTNAALTASFNGGNTWSEIPNSVLNVLTSVLVSGAYDEDVQVLYLVDDDGKLFKGRLSGGALSVANISANFAPLSLPAQLNFVRVLGANHVVVGGNSGILYESAKGGALGTWDAIAIPASENAIDLAGNLIRQALVTATKIYFRDPLTKMIFKVKALEDGVTVDGNYVAVRMFDKFDLNYFAAATSTGKVVLFKGFYPAA